MGERRILKEIETIAIRNASDLRVLVSITLDLQTRADALRAAATLPQQQNNHNFDLTALIDRYRSRVVMAGMVAQRYGSVLSPSQSTALPLGSTCKPCHTLLKLCSSTEPAMRKSS